MSRRHLRLAGLTVVGIALAAVAVVLLTGGLRVVHARSDLPRVPHIDGAPLRPRMELTSPQLGQPTAERPERAACGSYETLSATSQWASRLSRFPCVTTSHDLDEEQRRRTQRRNAAWNRLCSSASNSR
jgi:hypothetical protein